MRNIWNIIVEISVEAFHSFTYFVKNNLITFANILNIAAPYVMYLVGQYVAYDRDSIVVGGELLIPLIFIIFIYYLKSTANKLGKGMTIPIPEKRFTEVDDDGEVSIEQQRIQELILYVADLEDWMERKGLL